MVIARRAARRPGPREHDRIGLLERIGERLAGSLELNVTLRHVAETLVPQFADHCFIDLLHGDKLIRRAQSNARGWTPPPGSWAQVGEQIYYPEGHFCQQAMAQLDAVVVPDLRDRRFPAPNARSLRAREDVGRRLGRRRPAVRTRRAARRDEPGAVPAVGPRERHYDAEDRGFMAAIASRVAIAIDNAMLFEEERRTALAFQTSLLPQRLPTLDGLEVAWRYMPAKPLETHGQGIQTQVGGDWYDLIPLSAGRVGIVIGDVEGRGARAAAVMGQLRAALRAFAQDDKPPAEIMRKLDDWCRTLGPATPDSPGQLDPPMASCTYLVYDAWSRTLSFSNAGHEAPLLITDGEVGELEIEHKGVLLGVRGGIPGLPTYREEVRQLPPGSTLVFYTDGLTDRRQRSDGNGHYTEDEALEMLRAAVGVVADQDVEAIAQAAEEAVPGDIDDDMAIVVVRTRRWTSPPWEATFPAEPIRVSEARRAGAVADRLGAGAGAGQLACLLVSEVVTNAVLHAAASPSPRRRARAGDGRGVPGAAVPAGPWDEIAGGVGTRRRPRVHAAAAPRRGRWCGSRSSTPTCGCPDPQRGRDRRGRAAACTWWTRSPPGGGPGPPGTASRSGSRCRSTEAGSRRGNGGGAGAQPSVGSVAGGPGPHGEHDRTRNDESARSAPVVPMPARRRSLEAEREQQREEHQQDQPGEPSAPPPLLASRRGGAYSYEHRLTRSGASWRATHGASVGRRGQVVVMQAGSDVNPAVTQVD